MPRSFYSPFQSERLGSYCYSKMAQAVEDKGLTGVPAFDQAVKYFAGSRPGRGWRVCSVRSEVRAGVEAALPRE